MPGRALQKLISTIGQLLSSIWKRNSVQAPEPDAASSTPANWSELLPGDNVILIGKEAQRDAGIVDTVSRDGTLLWIGLGHGNERRLFLREEVLRTEVDLRDLERRKNLPATHQP
jgi:hypothetical protein